MGKEEKRVVLDESLVKKLWSNPQNERGEPDWSHLFPYYHPDIVFRDPIQEIEGIDAFIRMSRRLTKRCRTLEMNLPSVVCGENTIFFQWEMTMKFRSFPSGTIYGCSRLLLHEDGRIVDQRDYYDLWGDIYDRVPGFGRLYRWFMRKRFG